MTWTITGTGSHTPLQIVEYSSGRPSGNTVDQQIDSSIAVQLGDAPPARGRFRALFDVLSAALACREDIATGHTLTVTDDDDTELDMTFILADGGMAEVVANTDAGVWLLSIDFQEVPA